MYVMYVCNNVCNVENKFCLSFSLSPLLMFSQFPFYYFNVFLCITSDCLSLSLSPCIYNLLLVFHDLWFHACTFASKQLTKKLWFIDRPWLPLGVWSSVISPSPLNSLSLSSENWNRRYSYFFWTDYDGFCKILLSRVKRFVLLCINL